MQPPTYSSILTLLLLASTTTPTLSIPIPPPSHLPSSSSIFTTHFHSLLSTRDSAHALLLSSPRRELQTSSNLVSRSASPDASTLYPSSLHHHSSSSSSRGEEDRFEFSSSPVPSRSLDTTFRSPRLDGREGRVSKGGWLSWVVAAPGRGVRGLSGGRGGKAGEEGRWRAWEGVDHLI